MSKPKAQRDGGPKRFEFSKLIVVLAIIMWIAVNVFGMVMMAITGDLSPMVYVLGSVDAVMAVICTTYSYKAKAENVIKLRKIYGVDTSDLARESDADIGRFYSRYDDVEEDASEDDAPKHEDASIV